MELNNLNERYAQEIYDLLLSGFDDDNENKRWDLQEVNATQWFTGLVKASAIIFNRFTDDEKNYIEWTHLSQNLLIQDMIEKKEAA